MKSHKRTSLAILLVGLLCILGCFPNFQATTIQRESINKITKIDSPTKAHLIDASVILFPKGFTVRGDTVIGQGQRFWIDRSDSIYLVRSIPLDSIVAMTSYNSNISFGRGIASFLLGVTGTVMTPLSIYCLACPKCCFGSCPTVYTLDERNKTLQAELFPHSISRQLEDQDLDLLDYQVRGDATVQLLLTNEALETHYVNRFSLLAARHPAGTRLFPSETNSLVIIGDIHPPSSAVTRDGRDVLSLVKCPDSLAYRTDIAQFPLLAERGEHDWVECSVTVPEGTRRLKILLRLRNTLLSTTLFYDVVLASQGIDALNWNHRMNNDETYAAQFRRVYDAFSGIAVSIHQDGKWVKHSTIRDVGPITWKYVATEIPVKQTGEVHVRLSSFPDNVAIDYVGFSFDKEETDGIQIEEISAKQIFDNTGTERDDIISDLLFDDERYLVTNPGDSYRLQFNVKAQEASELTLFVSSKGYYTEWIRGSWLRVPNAAYRFDLSDTQGTLSWLVKSWLQSKDEMEQKFFQSRIPIRRQR